MPDQPSDRPGRNDPCRCGSGRKYKQCCLDKDQATDREARVKETEADAQAPSSGESTPHPQGPKPKHATEQPWKRTQANIRGFPRLNTQRKVGGG